MDSSDGQRPDSLVASAYGAAIAVAANPAAISMNSSDIKGKMPQSNQKCTRTAVKLICEF